MPSSKKPEQTGAEAVVTGNLQYYKPLLSKNMLVLALPNFWKDFFHDRSKRSLPADVYKRLMVFHGLLKDIDYKGRQEIVLKKVITNLNGSSQNIYQAAQICSRL